jgi:hypothetical protein
MWWLIEEKREDCYSDEYTEQVVGGVLRGVERRRKTASRDAGGARSKQPEANRKASSWRQRMPVSKSMWWNQADICQGAAAAIISA